MNKNLWCNFENDLLDLYNLQFQILHQKKFILKIGAWSGFKMGFHSIYIAHI
jgi:hypothetical protein